MKTFLAAFRALFARQKDLSRSENTIDVSSAENLVSALPMNRELLNLGLTKKIAIFKKCMLVFQRLNDLCYRNKLYGLSKVYINPNFRSSKLIKEKLDEPFNDVSASQVVETDRFIILHTSFFYFIWVVASFLTCFYYFITMPFLRCLRIDIFVLDLFEWALEIFFVIDFFLTFNLSYTTNQGILVTSRFQIIRRVFQKHLIFKFIVSFPLTLVFSRLGVTLPFNKFLLVFNLNDQLDFISKSDHILFSFLKNKLGFNTSRYQIRVYDKFFRSLSLFVIAFAVMHFGACMFLILGNFADYDYDWTVKNGLSNASYGELYLSAFYFCLCILTTVGFGDISPANTYERMFSIFWMIFGITFYAFLMSSMTSIFAFGDTRVSLHNKRIGQVEQFQKVHSLPLELLEQTFENVSYASSQVAYRWVEPEKDITKDLSIEDTNQFFRELHPGVSKSVFFDTKDRSFLIKVLPLLRPTLIKKGEFLWSKHDPATYIAIISKGTFMMMEDNIFLSELDKIAEKQSKFDFGAHDEPSIALPLRCNMSFLKAERSPKRPSVEPSELHTEEKLKTSIKDMLSSPFLAFEKFMDGAYFGEEEIFFKTNRRYHVKATCDSEVMMLTRIDFEGKIKDSFPHIYRTMANRAYLKFSNHLKNRDKLLKYISSEILICTGSVFNIEHFQKKLEFEQFNLEHRFDDVTSLEQLNEKVSDDHQIEKTLEQSMKKSQSNRDTDILSSPGTKRMFRSWQSILIS